MRHKFCIGNVLDVEVVAERTPVDRHLQLERLIANANERIAELEKRAAMIMRQRDGWQKELDDAT